MKEAFIRVWVNNVKKSKFQLFQENLIMMDSSRMDEQALEKMFRVIEKKKVKCLVGYSSALGELSNYIQKTGKDCSRCKVKAIIPISETMPEPVRRTLENSLTARYVPGIPMKKTELWDCRMKIMRGTGSTPKRIIMKS